MNTDDPRQILLTISLEANSHNPLVLKAIREIDLLTFTSVMSQVFKERVRQVLKFGVQRLPSDTGKSGWKRTASIVKRRMNALLKFGHPTWSMVLLEEVYEALSEADPERLHEELIQIIAVCANWLETLDTCGTSGAQR